jgi:hypothetical protein
VGPIQRTHGYREVIRHASSVFIRVHPWFPS